MPFSIGVIGTGYVGLVSGTCFAETGNSVICIDIDEAKVNQLRTGKPTIYEPGLENLLQRNVREGRMKFSTDLKEAVLNCSIIFLCLPTPPDEDGSADLSYVLDAAQNIGKILKEHNLTDFRIIVDKSTVPVGTAPKVRAAIMNEFSEAHIDVVSNPEFLREGFAIEDSMKPDRVVIGTSNADSAKIMSELYEPFTRSGNPIFVLDEPSAELTKYAANSYLAMRISFMNDLSAYAEAIGADIDSVRLGMGADSRIGKRFLFAGLGYGGSCFPKDVRALMTSAKEKGIDLALVRTTEDVNKRQTERFIGRILQRFDNNVAGKKFAIWGLAFKPNTDDTREAPAFSVIQALLDGGAQVSAFDPEAMPNTERIFGDKIHYGKNMNDTLPEADALIICTEWNEFRNPDFALVKFSLRQPLIFDGRNLFDTEKIKTLGVEYHSIGRASVYPA